MAVELVKLHEREVEMNGAKFRLKRLPDETRMRLIGKLKNYYTEEAPEQEKGSKTMSLEELGRMMGVCTEALQEAMIGWSGVESEGVEVPFDKRLVPELPTDIRAELGRDCLDIGSMVVPKDLEGNSEG